MPNRTLVRALTRWDLTALAINGIIGAGILGLPSSAAKLLGNASPIAFVACALVVYLVVLCFAEVASRFSESGGPYLYARDVFGSFIGFEVGWGVWLARVAAFAANTNVFISYLGFFVPGVTEGVFRALAMSALVGLLTAVNIRGVQAAALFGNAFALLKLIPLFLFGLVGLFFVDWSNYQNVAMPAAGNFGAAMLLLVYAFTGFEYAVIPAAEARNPRKDVGWALLYALGIATVLYIAIQVVAVGTLDDLANSQRPLADAGRSFLGPVAGAIMAATALFSLTGNLSALILVTPRLTYAFSERGDFPAVFSSVHSRYRTPVASILMFSIVGLALAISGTFVWLVTVGVIARLGTYICTSAAAPILRKRFAERPHFQMMFGPLIPILCILLVLWLWSNTTLRDNLAVLAASAAGAVVYFSVTLRKVRPLGPSA